MYEYNQRIMDEKVMWIINKGSEKNIQVGIIILKKMKKRASNDKKR